MITPITIHDLEAVRLDYSVSASLLPAFTTCYITIMRPVLIPRLTCKRCSTASRPKPRRCSGTRRHARRSGTEGGTMEDCRRQLAKQEAVFNWTTYGQNPARTLGQLGYDKLVEQTVTALPDAQDRLAYRSI